MWQLRGISAKYQGPDQIATKNRGKTQNYQNSYWRSVYLLTEMPHTKNYAPGTLGDPDIAWTATSVKSGSIMELTCI